jgi:hypothetical protein
MITNLSSEELLRSEGLAGHVAFEDLPENRVRITIGAMKWNPGGILEFGQLEMTCNDLQSTTRFHLFNRFVDHIEMASPHTFRIGIEGAGSRQFKSPK